MAQFVGFDPKVQVSGQSMMITIQAMGERVHPVLKKHGMENLQADRWYPQQPYLDFFREIAQGDFSSVLDLVSIGMNVPTLAYWPENIRTIEDALFSIGQAYEMNHKGGRIGSYQAVSTGERQIEVRCENPYPCDFDYGLVYNTAKLYQPADGHVMVAHVDTGECRKFGGDVCIYRVTW